MKVAMHYSPTDIRYEDAPIPKIGSGEVLVEMKSCGLCGSDLMNWYLKDRTPLVLGHEPSGVVVQTKNKNFKEGDRLFVHHHVPCLTCHYCIRGKFTMCEQYRRSNIYPGGFAQYFKVPAANLLLDTLKIPDSISFDESTIIEPTACCIRALKKSNIRQGDMVVVIGAGSSGIIHTMLLRLLGVDRIIISDLIDYRLKLAKRHGADTVINPNRENFPERIREETEGRGGDVVIVTAPTIQAMLTGLDVCSKGGTLCIFAPTPPDQYLQISPNRLFFSEISIVSSYSTSHLETRVALKLIEAKKIDANALITHRFPLKYTDKAFKLALENKKNLKILIQSKNPQL